MVIIKTALAGVSGQALARFTERARKAAGLRGRVNVLLASSREVRNLNRRFRGKDAPTDVLSFPPAWQPVPQRRYSAGHWPLATDHFSGDIVISTSIAARNARAYGHAVAQELKILILHGLLHLAGYDHERDRGRMARREESLRRQLGLMDGLIRRTAQGPTGRRPSTVDRGRRG
jgi:probable rRNA maturation factor